MLLCNIPGSLKVDITSSFRSALRQTTEQVGHPLMLDGTLINELLSSYVSVKTKHAVITGGYTSPFWPCQHNHFTYTAVSLSQKLTEYIQNLSFNSILT